MAQRDVIHRALAVHINNNFSDASEVVWENTSYTPDLTTPWFEEFFLPNDSRQASLGLTGEQEDFGLYQINVNIPINQGTFLSDTYIDELSQLFKIGTILEKDGEKIYIENSTAAQGIPEENWYVVPFTISWSCYMTIN
jgi:hypothetical protein